MSLDGGFILSPVVVVYMTELKTELKTEHERYKEADIIAALKKRAISLKKRTDRTLKETISFRIPIELFSSLIYYTIFSLKPTLLLQEYYLNSVLVPVREDQTQD